MKKRDVRLSISIVAYHNYEDIMKAVESIARFTDAGLTRRIYIIDNSALDASDERRAAFERFLAGHVDTVYIDNGANVGFGKGHNVVLKYAESEYHAIVNPDIVLTEDAFTALIRYMENDPGCGMCVPRLNDSEGRLQAVYREYPTVADMFIRMFVPKLFPKRIAAHTLQHMDYTKPFRVPFAQGSFLLIRTGLFREMGGFDDRYFMYMEDADLCRRVNEKHRVMYVPDAGVVHRWERGSHKSGRLLRIHIESMVRYFAKWGWKLL